MKLRLPFTPKYSIFSFILLFISIIVITYLLGIRIKIADKLDVKNIEIAYEPRGEYEYLAYLKINKNGKAIIGPKNMVLQNKDRSVIETDDLLNNGRKQIVASSLWGPYSSVTYLYDYDGNVLKPLCRETSKQDLSSEYKEVFKDYPDNGLCAFFASRGKSIEDVDNDKVKEIIIVGNLINHVCPAVRITTYKWNEDKFIIKSEEEENPRPDLKECNPLPSEYPIPTNYYPDSGKKCSDGSQCPSGWCLGWKCSPEGFFIFDSPHPLFASASVVINSKVFPIYIYDGSPNTIHIGKNDGSVEYQQLKKRLCPTPPIIDSSYRGKICIDDFDLKK